MQKHGTKKTKSAPKKLFWVVFSVASLAAIVAAYLLFSNFDKVESEKEVANNSSQVTRCLRLKDPEDCLFKLEVVNTDESRVQGLSGRQALAKDTGMLFEFDQPSRQCFWMKDMNFAIDMIWIDSNRVITKIEQNVKPESFPNQYCSVGLDQYVLEVNAGMSESAGLSVGESVSLY